MYLGLRINSISDTLINSIIPHPREVPEKDIEFRTLPPFLSRPLNFRSLAHLPDDVSKPLKFLNIQTYID